MAGARGYHTYRGRTPKGKIALAVLLVLIILAAVGFLWLQEYIVYDRDGSFHLELPWKTETPPAEEEVPPEDVEITIQEPEKPKGSWNKRFHANLERMKSGDICDVAAVARNLILQDRRRHISSGERRLLDLAKQILVSELVYACNKTPKEIENWLTSVLSENAFAH